MTSNDFSEYYKTISNAELLIILENSKNYQPLAVEAAKKEFINRQLSDTEIKQAKQVLITQQVHKAEQRKKLKTFENKIKSSVETIVESHDPFQKRISLAEKTIRIFIIAFTFLFVYQFVTNFRINLIVIRDIPGFPFESILHLFPQVLLPIATFLFWKRKAWGWILLATFLTFSTVGAVVLLYQSLTWQSSGLGNLDIIFPRPSSTTAVFQLIILIVTMYVLCKATIRENFKINEQKMWGTIVISGLATLALVILIS